jgi:hypothetical protein
MLLELPDELLSNVLWTWMTMVEVARMDSAFCSGESIMISVRARVMLVRSSCTLLCTLKSKTCATLSLHGC